SHHQFRTARHPLSLHDALPISTEQQREIWSSVQMGEGASCAFNQSISLRLTGALDAAALRAGIDGVVQRHDALRGTFSPDGATLDRKSTRLNSSHQIISYAVFC